MVLNAADLSLMARNLKSVITPITLTALAFAALVAGRFGLEALVQQFPRGAEEARDLSGVMLVAMVVSPAAVWIVRRWVPSLQGDDPASSYSPRRLGAWLLGVRWIAAIAIIAVAFQAVVIDTRLEPAGGVILWIVVGLLVVFNLLLTAVGPDTAAIPRLVILQVVVDSALLAVSLHAAGGIVNPFAALFVFHAVIAGLLLPRAPAARAIALVALVPAVLAAVEATALLPALCVKQDGGGCLASDRLTIVAAGTAVIVVTVGCGFLVARLTRHLHTERDALMAARVSLAAEQGKLHAVVHCIADAVLFAAPDGRILLRNRAAAALWPDRREGPADDLRVCHTEDRWAQMLDKLMHATDLEHHPLLPIGGRTWEATYGRVTTPDGASLGAVMVARDVTERLKDEALRAERERLSTIGKLAAGLAHEINNPLGSIQLYTQHALKKLDAMDPLAEHLGTVLRNANVCKKIVRDLLEYARQRPPEVSVVAPGELIALAQKTIQPQADTARVEIVTRLAEATPAVSVDISQIVQILVNLGMNGIDAMVGEAPAADGVDAPRTLTLAVGPERGEIVLTVDDTGPGIPEAAAGQIFSPFFTTKPEGTGLGLAVAKDIARAHGGRVELRPKTGRGACFALVLPAASKGTRLV